MLSFKDVILKVDKRELVTLPNLQLNRGVVALIGRNGTGKSTLLRTIVGLHTHFSGQIELNGESITKLSPVKLAKTISFVNTKPLLFGRHTAREVLILGRLPHQNFLATLTKKDNQIVDEIIELLALNELANQLFSTLSDGEKQLVMIGRALVQETPVLLLDEPGAFLDLVNRRSLMELIAKIAAEQNKLVFFSTHQIDYLPEFCDAILLIDKKNIKKIDDPTAFITTVEEAFHLKKQSK